MVLTKVSSKGEQRISESPRPMQSSEPAATPKRSARGRSSERHHDPERSMRTDRRACKWFRHKRPTERPSERDGLQLVDDKKVELVHDEPS